MNLSVFKPVFKKVYNLIPYKSHIYVLLRNSIKLSPSLFQHLHFKGAFKVKIDDKNYFTMFHHGYILENNIFWRGLENGYETGTMKLWIELCKNSKTILDIGANTGVYSLVAKTLNKTAEVIAFEPVERVFDKLVLNNKLNTSNITCVKKAASDYDGIATIHDSPTEHTYNATLNKQSHHRETHTVQTKIEVIRLSTYIEENSIRNVDLIKIDAERHEANVIRGLFHYITEYKPTLLIEILSEEIASEVQSLLSEQNYNYYNIIDNKGLVRVTKITKGKGVNYLVCSQSVAKSLNLEI